MRERLASGGVLSTAATSCRACGAPLDQIVVDLGVTPLANSYLSDADLARQEPRYPLRVRICKSCLLVQLDEVADASGIFVDEYPYFSSFSETWLRHAQQYVDDVIERFNLGPHSQVVEVASNDGYLLRNFVARNIPALGIEPAGNVAAAAIAAGIPTRVAFFNSATATQLIQDGFRADLVIGNNVLAHVPALNDFVRALAMVLKPTGVITLEFPHLARLLSECQFDTIYHEHFSYFSLLSVEHVLAAQELTVLDVEELPTHGGSLRLFVRHAHNGTQPPEARVAALRQRERAAGLGDLSTYTTFGKSVDRCRESLRRFLITARQDGKRVAAYGAPAKGNTLLNYCGVGPDLVAFTVDRNPAKQGRYLPGTRIPIRHPEHLRDARPDYLLLLPWNLRDEIMEQASFIRQWGGKFVVPIPEVSVHE
jgi:2-polyprenyl-3-methyl-5-hydroxy-6-metoxy-1,4-benzoquinol methylase